MSDEHIRGLRDALSHSPNNPPLLKLLAEALTQQGQHLEAEDVWKELLKVQPNGEDARMGLARCYFEQGKDQAAIVICEEILGNESDHAHANLLMARCQYRMGNLAEATDAYRNAKTKDGSIYEPAFEELLDTQGVGLNESDDVDDSMYTIDRPDIKFANVGGMETLKDEIRMKIIHPLAHPELFKAYGKSIGGGLLLYGPPGCGKTHIARATAGEVDAHFLPVGISDVLDMWIGSSEKNLTQLFEQARSHKPCVVFFDEVDALAASRRDMRQSAGRQLINTFLSELDGINQNNDGLLIMAATNAPWHLDSAFRRPGRFDRILFVPPPDQNARAAILRVLLADKPTDKVDVDVIARKTEHFSGADLKGVLDVCVEDKLRIALASGKPEPMTTKDILKAVKKVKPSTREWLSSAKNHALYSNQDGTYDDVLTYLNIKK